MSTAFTSLVLSSFQLPPVYAISFSLLIFGLPHAIFSIPAYFLGQKASYKWAVVTGQVLVYLYSLYNMLDCSLSHCVYKWQTAEMSTPAFSLIIFCLSVPLLTMNLWLLALEQIPLESSETKSVCIHWMWLVFFLGRLIGAFTGSAIFWWTSPVFLFVVQLSLASTAIIIIIWAPLEKLVVGSYSMPFRVLWQVTREASKQLCNRRIGQLQRRVDVPETYDPDYEPNAFERASHDFSGPLPTQDVRDVQKFYLTLLMLVSLVGIYILYSLVSVQMWIGALNMCIYVWAVHVCSCDTCSCMYMYIHVNKPILYTVYRSCCHSNRCLNAVSRPRRHHSCAFAPRSIMVYCVTAGL